MEGLILSCEKGGQVPDKVGERFQIKADEVWERD